MMGGDLRAHDLIPRLRGAHTRTIRGWGNLLFVRAFEDPATGVTLYVQTAKLRAIAKLYPRARVAFDEGSEMLIYMWPRGRLALHCRTSLQWTALGRPR